MLQRQIVFITFILDILLQIRMSGQDLENYTNMSDTETYYVILRKVF